MKKVTPIHQRTNSDCMVCCLAMALDWTYEEAARYFPPIALEGRGCMWDNVLPLLEEDGYNYEIHWHGMQNIKGVSLLNTLILDVPSLKHPGGEHSVVWDGVKVIDPSPDEPKYEEFPDWRWAYRIFKRNNQ